MSSRTIGFAASALVLAASAGFEVTAPESIAGVYDVASAGFGPTDAASATGDLVLVDDGSESASQGCEPRVGDLTGLIAVAGRGSCTFVSKARNAQDAGASALIIINNVESEPTELPPLGGFTEDVTIPILGMRSAAAIHRSNR